MSNPSFRQKSKNDYHTGVDASHEELQTGCLQRIADGMEAMGNNWRSLVNDLSWQKDENRRLQARIADLNRQVSSFRGVITKLKKKQAKS